MPYQRRNKDSQRKLIFIFPRLLSRHRIPYVVFHLSNLLKAFTFLNHYPRIKRVLEIEGFFYGIQKRPDRWDV